MKETQCTYFIQAKSGGPIKIGKAKNPDSRLRELQGSNWEELQIIGIIYDDVEKELHQTFSPYRIRGEWFENSQVIRDYVRDSAQVLAESQEQVENRWVLIHDIFISTTATYEWAELVLEYLGLNDDYDDWFDVTGRKDLQA